MAETFGPRLRRLREAEALTYAEREVTPRFLERLGA